MITFFIHFYRSTNKDLFIFFIIFFQGLCSAIPFALISGTLQIWYLANGINLNALGWLALLTQAYVFKFLWANYCDTYSIYPPFLRKSWILLTQWLLFILLMMISFLNPLHHFYFLSAVAVLTALISATQDLNIDGYRTDLMQQYKNKERFISISYIFGFRLGYLIAGAGVFLIAQYSSWQLGFQLMAIIMLLGSLITFISHEAPRNNTHVTLSRIKAIKSLWTTNTSRLLFVFVFLFECGDSLVMSIYPAYLYQIKHYNLTQLALLMKTTNLCALALSPFISILLLKYVTLSRVLIICSALEGLCLLGLFLFNDNLSHLFWLQLCLGLFEGLSGVLIILVYTSMAKGPMSAFNYSFIAALGGLKSLFTTSIALSIIFYFDWATLFYIGALISLPVCILIMLLSPTLDEIAV